MQDNLLRRILTERFKGIIWKIETDHALNIISIETRDIETHTAYVSAFNFLTGECYFKEITVQNGWWQGLDKIYKETIFLHGYANESSPEHKGILALDACTGQKKWEQFNMAIDGISINGPVAYNTLMKPHKLILLSADTGEHLPGVITDYQSVSSPVLLPFAVTGSTSLPKFIPADVAGQVFMLAYNNKTCWSFHTKKANLFTQHLLITMEDEILLEDILAEGIQKMNPEAFFVQQNSLFYIRNKVEMITYLL